MEKLIRKALENLDFLLSTIRTGLSLLWGTHLFWLSKDPTASGLRMVLDVNYIGFWQGPLDQDMRTAKLSFQEQKSQHG